MSLKTNFRNLVSIFFTSAYLCGTNASTTISGLHPDSIIKINIEKICIANPFIPATVRKLGFIPANVDVGLFRAEYHLDNKQLSVNKKPLPNNSRFSLKDFEAKIKKVAYGSEYTFKDFEIIIPVTDIEPILGDILAPSARNLLDGFASDRVEFIRTLGIVINVDNVNSLVAFNGKYSRVASNLMDRDNEGVYYYEHLWPQMASLLNNSRIILTRPSGQVDYREDLECFDYSFIKYSVEVQ